MNLLRMMLVVVAAMAGGTSAHAADIRILMSGAFKSSMTEIRPLFERAAGHRLVVEDDTSPRIARRVADGEAVDVIIISSGGIDELIKNQSAMADSKIPLGRSGFGVMVRKGAPKPDVSTPDAFKRALLDARSVGYTDPKNGGQSGVHFARVLAQLGIADEINKKAKLGDADPIALIVGRGEAEIGVHPIPEILARPDLVDLVGPLPGPFQSYNNLAAAIPVKANKPDAARAFVKFLTEPPAKAILKARGLELD